MGEDGKPSSEGAPKTIEINLGDTDVDDSKYQTSNSERLKLIFSRILTLGLLVGFTSLSLVFVPPSHDEMFTMCFLLPLWLILAFIIFRK